MFDRSIIRWLGTLVWLLALTCGMEPARASSVLELIGADSYVYPSAPQPQIFFSPDPILTVLDFKITLDTPSAVNITPVGSPFQLYQVGLLATMNAQMQVGPHVTIDGSGSGELRLSNPIALPGGSQLYPYQLNNVLMSMPPSGGLGPFVLRTPFAASGQLLVDSGGMRIGSFFDIFTELSVDGGQTFLPASGLMRMTAVPSPAAAPMGLIGLMFLALRRRIPLSPNPDRTSTARRSS